MRLLYECLHELNKHAKQTFGFCNVHISLRTSAGHFVKKRPLLVKNVVEYHANCHFRMVPRVLVASTRLCETSKTNCIQPRRRERWQLKSLYRSVPTQYTTNANGLRVILCAPCGTLSRMYHAAEKILSPGRNVLECVNSGRSYLSHPATMRGFLLGQVTYVSSL